ncbi:MAG: glycosyltransferase [Oxalobacter sp.]|nr:glycosyltransferase [Oxalobacter sp.]
MRTEKPDSALMDIAVVIPVHNIAPYVRHCLDSLLAQVYPHWVAYVVDDGSTDESGQILDEYAARDSRFRVFHKPNGGVGSARNFGLLKVEQDLQAFAAVTFLDGDDWLAPDAYSVLLPKMLSEKADILFSGFRSAFPGKLVERKFVHSEGFFSKLDFVEAVCSYEDWAGRNGSWGVVWNKIFRPQMVAGLRFIEERDILEDEMFCLQAALRGSRFYFVNCSYYFYRKRKNSLLNTQDINKRIARGRLLELSFLEGNREFQERLRPAMGGIFLKAKEEDLRQFFEEGGLFAKVAKEALPAVEKWHEAKLISDSDYRFFQTMADAQVPEAPVDGLPVDFLGGLPPAGQLAVQLMLDEIKVLKKRVKFQDADIANLKKKLSAEKGR